MSRRLNEQSGGSGAVRYGMEFSQWAQRFSSAPPPPGTASESDRILHQFRTANDWFGDQLYGWLLLDWSEPAADLTDEATEFENTWRGLMEQYSQMVAVSVNAVGHRAQSAADAEGRIFPGNEINFHVLNHAMLSMWSLALDIPTAHSRAREIYEAQLSLALAGTRHAEDRVRRTGKEPESYYSPDNADYRRRISGIATEIDAAIVLLELCKRHPALCVVPAPRRFEEFGVRHASSDGGRVTSANSDFVLLNMDEQQVTGVQVKTWAPGCDVARYSSDHVVILDGVHDLGNTRPVRLEPRSSELSDRAWPGLIATGFLGNAPAKALGRRADGDELRRLIRVRERARDLSHGFRFLLGDAVDRIEAVVASRVL